MKRHRRIAGYSLTELMVGVALTGIIVAATVPNLRSYRESQRMTAAGDQIASAIREAQARARSQNHEIVVEYRPLSNEFAVIDDVNGNGAADVGEQVTVSALPTGVTLASTTLTSDQLLFNGRGRSVNSGSIVLSGNYVSNREISVAAGTGRVKVTTPEP
jgi:type IV fimbrial biogenesis protein FimT